MLDWDRIKELREEVGDDEFQLILELFLDEVEGVMMRLSRRDPARLETDLHFLKGCAANLGFAEFGRLCDRAEQHAAARDCDNICINELLRVYSESKQMLMRDMQAGQTRRQTPRRA
ncbi:MULTISPECIES: Hpt domain-containing protein [unclassified Paracoccus (in: a-proteobacteria)]|uniref:Hpt domain-containing protein n=1 Tax=unclassified Paracoccus (in: a-proteobacteria) TaxID=2688777 RepID=UPI0012B35718|nr:MULTISPECIES: Hpt domain-containing protein [unclassified Paracoccus (in: a-proteobacteria)]UXU75347.1 Hpt domain-containing protein [Paracoccus sp. SMMA_5]UXU81250.1 Hpt domain-containing protein [Paracoccus sp. SMMA_5_TC]